MKGSAESVCRGADESVYRISPSERPSEAVVEAAADATGARAIGSIDADGSASDDALDPLYGTIDPEALDALLRSADEGDRRSEVCVSFSYAGCAIEVHSRGLVTVRRMEKPLTPEGR